MMMMMMMEINFYACCAHKITSCMCPQHNMHKFDLFCKLNDANDIFCGSCCCCCYCIQVFRADTAAAFTQQIMSIYLMVWLVVFYDSKRLLCVEQ